jgi:ribosome-binding factor A
MSERRPERVAHLVQAKLAELLIREARDPRLREVTLTAVRMTPDLRSARVYFRVLGGGDISPIQRALERATPYLRGQVGRALGLRVTPELRFEFDSTPDQARRVDALLRAAGTPASDEEKT